MENTRLEASVSSLKKCKAEGKTYYEATQILAQQGYSQAEIEQASYQFPYTTISPADSENNPAQNLLQLQPTDSKEVEHEIELQQTKQQLRQDYWYSFIPIVGAFYRTKRVGDYTKYESLRTGHSQAAVLTTWIGVMIVGAFVALVAAPRVVSIFTKNSTAMGWSHYAGFILAILLLSIIFRKKSRT